MALKFKFGIGGLTEQIVLAFISSMNLNWNTGVIFLNSLFVKGSKFRASVFKKVLEGALMEGFPLVVATVCCIA